MNRRLFRRCAAWLLPLVALRAFLPVGFMLSASAQGLALAFCPSQSPALVHALESGPAAGHASHLAHAMHHGGSPSQLDTPCPYALAAVAVAVEIPPCDVAALPLADKLVQQRSIFLPGAGPLRADRIRGPPSFS